MWLMNKVYVWSFIIKWSFSWYFESWWNWDIFVEYFCCWANACDSEAPSFDIILNYFLFSPYLINDLILLNFFSIILEKIYKNSQSI